MTLEEGKRVLGDSITEDGDIYNLGHYMYWKKGEETICLDSHFDIKELEAIVVYIKANQ